MNLPATMMSGSGSGADNVTTSSSSSHGIVVIPTDEDNLALAAIITVFLQLAVYLVACSCKFDYLTDFAGGTNFLLLAVVSFGLSDYNARQIVITVLVVLYGVRLAGYLLLRILKTGKDQRFDGIREKPLKFLVFFILQIFWVYIVSLTVLFINSPSAPPVSFGPSDIIGAILFLSGLVYEAVADQHKYVFRNNPNNRGNFIKSGLWALSRHPNYFGEMCVWLGAFILSAAVLRDARWVAVLSPLFITTLLVFGSGMPTTERSSYRKYGGDPDYQKYLQSVAPLIPWIPPLYQLSPYPLKLLFCCEFPFYRPSTPQLTEETGEGKGKGEIVDQQPRANETTPIAANP